MSDLATLLALRTSAYQLCDVENAVNRFPAAEVTGYVNAGLKRVYAEMMKAWDQPFYISETVLPVPVAVWGQPTNLPLPMDYLQMVGLSWAASSMGPWHIIERYRDEQERTRLLANSVCASPGHFRWGFAASPVAFTQGIPPTTYSIELVPSPSLGSSLRLRYVPSFQPLVSDSDRFDGVLSFYDAATVWAAILMRRKDDLDTSMLQTDWAQHVERITAIARRRDRSAPPQTSIVANWGSGRGRRRGGGRW